jgi:vacuolar-type H+-ATPase subunit H
VISHSDSDHYNGFDLLFDAKDKQGNDLKNLTIGTIYHNGIVERAGKDALGPKEGGFLTDVIVDKAAMENLLSKPSNITDPKTKKSKQYPAMLKKALDSGRVKDIRMLCSEDKYMPGYEEGNDLSIEVSGPFPEENSKGKRLLRWFQDVGKTKNGHSVVLRLCYKKVKILLGGDLNIPSEEHLLRNHTKLNVPPKTDEEKRLVVEAARKVFQVDVAKACHHGSADFTELFLQAVNPIATVISSGDDEPHAHPRADTLGTLGKFSRGARSLIFSTELSRSAKETIKHPNIIKQEFKNADALVDEAKKQLKDATDAAKKKAEKKLEGAEKKRDKLREVLARSIAVYGAINVRTDGEKIVIAYRMERSKPSKKWDTYKLESVSGEFTFVSKH